MDLQESGEELSEHKKVQKFLTGLEGAPSLAAMRALVLSNTGLQNDFEGTVNYMSQFVDDMKLNTSHGIAEFSHGRGCGGRRG